MPSPFFIAWREKETKTATLVRTSRRMLVPSDVEHGFAEAAAKLGTDVHQGGWRLLIDLRGAPSVRVDRLVEAAIARERPNLYAPFESIAYLVGDERRRFQVERIARDRNFKVFLNELEARRHLAQRKAS